MHACVRYADLVPRIHISYRGFIIVCGALIYRSSKCAFTRESRVREEFHTSWWFKIKSESACDCISINQKDLNTYVSTSCWCVLYWIRTEYSIIVCYFDWYKLMESIWTIFRKIFSDDSRIKPPADQQEPKKAPYRINLFSETEHTKLCLIRPFRVTWNQHCIWLRNRISQLWKYHLMTIMHYNI